MCQNTAMQRQLTSHAPAIHAEVHAMDALIPFPPGGNNLGLGIRTSEAGLMSIDYVSSPSFFKPQTSKSNGMAREVVRQLECYFTDPQWQFDLPLDLHGTDFQIRLWSALSKIPAGSTDTYGQLARRLDSGAQAVGQACRRNPVPIVVPCHRVLSLQGVGGYAGAVSGEKLTIKLALLAHEGLEQEKPGHEH